MSVSLRRVRDGQQLWADRFDENWTNIFAAQDLVSQRVAAALALALTGEEQRRLTKRYTRESGSIWGLRPGPLFLEHGDRRGI